MSQQHPTRSTPARTPRPDASMSLLTNAMEHSLDDGYAEAAARRGEVGRSRMPRTLRAKVGLAVGLVLAALVVTVGAAQAQISAPSVAKEKQELIERIESGGQRADELQGDVDKLRTSVERQQRKALQKHGDERGRTTALLSGATAVEGPGLKLVVDDAEDAESGDGDGPRKTDGFSDTGRIRDRDLQRVVNGLWAAGAEAVSINGQRLTSRSAIRAAGDAILVDNKPLVPPYRLLAIGPGQQFSRTFQDSVDGQYLYVLHKDYGARTSISVQDKVRLPAAPSLILRTAKPVRTGKGSTS
ncbi:DUF881 domain-containing protein [Streptomyces sp. 8N114]|uniref:DUF881 domain-containing protein n=1 Tax=Streptomyces sp. 8N114 TaxID=3457419 RepID=UPI003FD5C725